MMIKCNLCGRIYDDATRWTICPHGPLWAGPNDYCPRHDLVNCFICKETQVNQGSRHPAVEHVLKFFSFAHLPAHLQDISKPFCELAVQVADRAPGNQETTVALRKLLEAKDAAVRAVLP